MAPARITVVGGVSRDTIVTVDALPAARETAPARAVHVAGGGKARNQALAAAGAGASVAVVGRVGEDRAGRDAVDELGAAGIDTTRLDVVPGEATGRYVALVAPGGSWTGAFRGGANLTLGAEHLAAAAEQIARATHLLCQLEVCDEAVEAARRLSRGRVVLDVGPAPERAGRHMAGAWMVRANGTEAEALTGVEVADEGSARRAAAALLARGPRWASVSAGAAGELLATEEESWWMPAPELDVVDTTGAGDALLGVTVALLAAGAPPDEAARAGAQAGWQVTQHLGAGGVR